MNHFRRSTWSRFSKKLGARIENPKYAGFFKEGHSEMRLIAGFEEQGWMWVRLSWLVDETDGVIADAAFQVFGPPALIGAAESASEIVIRKTYDQARRITAELIDRQMRDRSEEDAFPNEAAPCLNLVVDAIEKASELCSGIPFNETFDESPVHLDFGSSGEYPGWEELSKAEKIAVIEAVISKEIRPYIELDAGGVQIIDLKENGELVISYQGSCTSCYSATGSTLNAIAQILQAKVSPKIVVVPDLSSLTLS